MSSALPPVCSCGRFMTCRRQHLRALTHTVHDQPDAIFAASEYGCLFDGACPNETQQTVLLLVGPAIAEHWQPSFAAELGRTRDKLMKVTHTTIDAARASQGIRNRSARMETPRHGAPPNDTTTD